MKGSHKKEKMNKTSTHKTKVGFRSDLRDDAEFVDQHQLLLSFGGPENDDTLAFGV